MRSCANTLLQGDCPAARLAQLRERAGQSGRPAGPASRRPPPPAAARGGGRGRASTRPPAPPPAPASSGWVRQWADRGFAAASCRGTQVCASPGRASSLPLMVWQLGAQAAAARRLSGYKTPSFQSLRTAGGGVLAPCLWHLAAHLVVNLLGVWDARPCSLCGRRCEHCCSIFALSRACQLGGCMLGRAGCWRRPVWHIMWVSPDAMGSSWHKPALACASSISHISVLGRQTHSRVFL